MPRDPDKQGPAERVSPPRRHPDPGVPLQELPEAVHVAPDEDHLGEAGAAPVDVALRLQEVWQAHI